MPMASLKARGLDRKPNVEDREKPVDNQSTRMRANLEA